ncbi:MAG: ATP-dependent DNA helicase [Lachnospiraceae bacterium]|nr:ATP-dependent DNA helicase [Lachnospiraceae bacterium]
MFELKNNVIRISVRHLVEFLFRKGDIRSGQGAVQSEKGMEAGSRIHRKIQKSMPVSYEAEVSLKKKVKGREYDIIIEGRADGIDKRTDSLLIDEIKGTYQNLDNMKEADQLHKAQAMCYALMYLQERIYPEVTIQITYCNLDTEEIRRFQEVWTKENLEQWFSDMLDQLFVFTDIIYESHRNGIESASQLPFPFEYRKGQKDMAATVYYAVREKRKLFVQAPTGVGKTMSTLYPSIKALGEEKASRIFYLTAKTITRTVAEESMETLQKKGLNMRFVTITAKDKLCVCEKRDCNPDTCERAKGHYDRVNQAIYELVRSEKKIKRDVILEYADRFCVCPYELCLDVSTFADIIICDYNYAFDPTVKLKRYFQGTKGDYIFLIDETHNLVERAREMYSAVLNKKDILNCRKILKEIDKRTVKKLNHANQKMLELKKESDGFTIYEDVDSLYLFLVRLKTEMDRFWEEDQKFEEREKVLDFYFQLCRFISVYENLDHCYKIYGEMGAEDFYIKLYCIQPCNQLAESLSKAVSAIFFSATILPVEYYKQVLCGNKDEYAVYIPTPFEEKKRALMIGEDVSSLYQRRNHQEYYKIYLHIISVITARKGNYIVFFPSYQFMEEVVDILYDEGYPYDYDLLVQDSSMMEKDKEAFLKRFEEGPILACCVLGGVFSEGIDLIGEKLIGTIMVGTGLPQVSSERNLLKDYYEESGEDGFAYAYLYPGMNKVLQAAGRVIRTTEDEGVILLLDERFLKPYYQKMFPREWTSYQVVNRYNSKQAITEFWDGRKKDEIQ